jgi:hypothetical protein
MNSKKVMREWYHELVEWLRVFHPTVYIDYKERIMAVHSQGVERRRKENNELRKNE